MRRLLSLAVLTFFPALLTAQEHGDAAAHWSYEGKTGPQHWGNLEAEYAVCKTGRQQSPMDIRKVERTNLPALDFKYHAAPLTIVNNGHTIQINYPPGSFLTVKGK